MESDTKCQSMPETTNVSSVELVGKEVDDLLACYQAEDEQMLQESIMNSIYQVGDDDGKFSDRKHSAIKSYQETYDYILNEYAEEYQDYKTTKRSYETTFEDFGEVDNSTNELIQDQLHEMDGKLEQLTTMVATIKHQQTSMFQLLSTVNEITTILATTMAAKPVSDKLGQ